MADHASQLDSALCALGRPERAEHERRYLRSELVHYGVSVPQLRAATLAWRAGIQPSHEELLALVEQLWDRGVYECRSAGVELLRHDVGQLTPDDLDRIEPLLRQARTWALIDGLAIWVIGALFEREPHRVGAWLDRWAVDDDFWLRRTALLALLPALRRGRELDRFTSYADGMLDEREFFIRKAIGWGLREAGRRRPDETAEWVRQHLARVSGVTLREAVKPLPPARRDALVTARRSKTRRRTIDR